jgi:Polyketide cyclase / dehydrase and lipid transport
LLSSASSLAPSNQEEHVASIRQEISIHAEPDQVWDALKDWGHLHERLARGFVLDTRLDGDDRIVTFSSGAVVREVLIDLDEAGRRLVWTIVDGPYLHHNGSAQVLGDGDGHARFIWVTDLLPNELAEPTGQMMKQGLRAIKATLDGAQEPHQERVGG